jgi:hypothetical protein
MFPVKCEIPVFVIAPTEVKRTKFSAVPIVGA